VATHPFSGRSRPTHDPRNDQEEVGQDEGKHEVLALAERFCGKDEENEGKEERQRAPPKMLASKDRPQSLL
jgi:hypothetical protein